MHFSNFSPKLWRGGEKKKKSIAKKTANCNMKQLQHKQNNVGSGAIFVKIHFHLQDLFQWRQTKQDTTWSWGNLHLYPTNLDFKHKWKIVLANFLFSSLPFFVWSQISVSVQLAQTKSFDINYTLKLQPSNLSVGNKERGGGDLSKIKNHECIRILLLTWLIPTIGPAQHSNVGQLPLTGDNATLWIT